MSKEPITIETLQQLLTRGPFNRWLNFTVIKTADEGIEMKAAWREEWVGNPDRRYTHGGILGAIIDVSAGYALAAKIGRAGPTLGFRVDYNKARMPLANAAKAHTR